MAGRRQPTDLVVLNGKKHLTRAEEDARRDAEVRVPPPAKVRAPSWLPDALRKDFRVLGKQLLAVGLYAALDADTLGRYLVAHQQWLAATAEVQRALQSRPRDAEAAEQWGRIQERYFKQARNCANDMGLTVSSRCRLILPSVAETAAADSAPDDDFMTRLRARQAAAGGD